MKEIGRSLDEQGGQRPLFRVANLQSPSESFEEKEPKVILDLPDCLVLSKPFGWEVERSGPQSSAILVEDQDATAELCTSLPPPLQLSVFLLSLQAAPWPISRDAAHHWGFLHRLDVPSSGLVLAAKTYEAFYDLKVQLNSGQIRRDYLVLCHGWLSPSREEIVAPVQWRRNNSAPSQVVIQGGKPSKTFVEVIAHAVRAGTNDEELDLRKFSLVKVCLDSGR